MKQSIRPGRLGLCLAVALAALWAGAARAQEAQETQETQGETEAVHVGDLLFVDVQEVLIGSSAMLDIRRQVNDQITAIRSDAQREEAALIEEEKQLKAKSDGLSEEEIQAGYRQLDEHLTTVRAELSQRLQSVQNGAFEAQREVENQLTDIFAELRAQRGATLLINPQGIVSAEAAYVIPAGQDITDEVVLLLDERLPAVIVMPRVIPPAPAVPAPAADEAADAAAAAAAEADDAAGADDEGAGTEAQ